MIDFRENGGYQSFLAVALKKARVGGDNVVRTPDEVHPRLDLIENMHAVTIQRLLDSDSLEIRSSIAKMLSTPGLLPAYTPILDRSWQVLAEVLQADSPTPPLNQRQLKAFFIGDALLHYTTLPYRERYQLIGENDEYVDVDGKNIPLENWLQDKFGDPTKAPRDEAAPQQLLRRVLEETREKLQRATLYPPASIADARACVYTADLVTMFYDSDFRVMWSTFREQTPWFETIRDQAIRNSFWENRFIEQLLISEELPEIRPETKLGLWTAKFAKDMPVIHTPQNDQDYQALVDYFLSHANVQAEFWKRYNYDRRDDVASPSYDDSVAERIPDRWKNKPEAVSLAIEAAHVPEAITNWFFEHPNPTIPEAFLGTISQAQLERRTAAAVFQKVIELAASFKVMYEDHNNIPGITRSLDGVNEATRIGWSTYVDILADQAPGFIFKDNKDKLRVRQPRGGQRVEEAAAAVEKAGGQIVYLSAQDWEHAREVNEEGRKRQEEALSVSTIRATIARFGEVGVVHPLDEPGFLDYLNSELAKPKYKMNQDRALEIWAQQDGLIKESSARPLTIIADLLPGYHPLSVLKEIGIVAIEQEADNMTFIADSATVGIQADIDKIAFPGNINGQDEVNVVFSGEAFQNTPLHLLFNAVKHLGTIEIKDVALDKQERSEVRSSVKSYNFRAKREHLPTVQFEEDPTKRKPTDQLTVTFIGKKPVFLVMG